MDIDSDVDEPFNQNTNRGRRQTTTEREIQKIVPKKRPTSVIISPRDLEDQNNKENSEDLSVSPQSENRNEKLSPQQFRIMKKSAISLQSLIRAKLSRDTLSALKREKIANFKLTKMSTIKIQSQVRQYNSQLLLEKLKLERDNDYEIRELEEKNREEQRLIEEETNKMIQELEVRNREEEKRIEEETKKLQILHQLEEIERKREEARLMLETIQRKKDEDLLRKQQQERDKQKEQQIREQQIREQQARENDEASTSPINDIEENESIEEVTRKLTPQGSPLIKNRSSTLSGIKKPVYIPPEKKTGLDSANETEQIQPKSRSQSIGDYPSLSLNPYSLQHASTPIPIINPTSSLQNSNGSFNNSSFSPSHSSSIPTSGTKENIKIMPRGKKELGGQTRVRMSQEIPKQESPSSSYESARVDNRASVELPKNFEPTRYFEPKNRPNSGDFGSKSPIERRYSEDGKMIYEDEDDVEFILINECEVSGSKAPSEKVFAILRAEEIEKFKQLKLIDKSVWKMFGTKGFPLLHQQLLKNAVARSIPAPVETPTKTVPDIKTQQSTIHIPPVQSPFTTQTETSVTFPDASAIFDTVKGWFTPDHPLKILEPIPTPQEEAEAEFFYPILKEQFVAGFLKPPTMTVLNLVLLSSHPNCNLSQQSSWRIEDHTSSDYCGEELVARVVETHPQLKNQSASHAKIQYVRQFNEIPILSFIVCDCMTEGYPWFRLGIDENMFYKFSEGDLEPEHSVPHMSITKTNNIIEEKLFEINLGDANIQFIYRNLEDGEKISKLFSHFITKAAKNRPAILKPIENLPLDDPNKPARKGFLSLNRDHNMRKSLQEKLSQEVINITVKLGKKQCQLDVKYDLIVSEVLALTIQSFGITSTDGRFGLKLANKNTWLDKHQIVGTQVPLKGAVLILATRLKLPSRAYGENLERTCVIFDFEETNYEVVKGNWDIELDVAIELAGLQLQTVFPDKFDLNPGLLNSEILAEYVTQQWCQLNNLNYSVFDAFVKARGINEIDTRLKYIKIAHSCKNYGENRYAVRTRQGTELLGVSSSYVNRISANDKKVIRQYSYDDIIAAFSDDNFITLNVAVEGQIVWQSSEASEIAGLINDYKLVKEEEKKKLEKENECLIM